MSKYSIFRYMVANMGDYLLKKLVPDIRKNTFSDNDIVCLFNILPCAPDFNLLALLSAQYYEKKECRARMIFLPSTTVSAELKLTPRYENPVRFDKEFVRQFTKFLAVSDKELALIMKCNSDNCYEAIGMSGEEIEKQEFVYRVDFNGYMNYSFYISEHLLFDFKSGAYKLPEDSEFDSLKDALKDFVIGDNEIQVFIQRIKKLKPMGHGTTMVLCSNACEYFYTKEIDRLAKAGRAVKIQPINLFGSDPVSNDEIDKFFCQTAIADGGFIIDCNGDCSAINVIFDGEVKSEWNGFKGVTSRGSRYNSLYTYIYGKNSACNSCSPQQDLCKKYSKRAIAIVISDDGMYNLISDGEDSN